MLFKKKKPSNKYFTECSIMKSPTCPHCTKNSLNEGEQRYMRVKQGANKRMGDPQRFPSRLPWKPHLLFRPFLLTQIAHSSLRMIPPQLVFWCVSALCSKIFKRMLWKFMEYKMCLINACQMQQLNFNSKMRNVRLFKQQLVLTRSRELFHVS